MFTQSERDLLTVSRALLNLNGFFLVTEENTILDNPIILVDLLTKMEIETFKTLLKVSPSDRVEIEENIVENKFLALLGSTYKINFNFTPAGVITSIAEAIVKKSEEFLENKDNIPYLETAESVSYLETMSAIISYYTNTAYEKVIALPVNEIYKRYAVCQQAFPNQIQPLTNE